MLKDICSKIVVTLRNSSLAKDSFWAVLGSVVGKGLALIAGIFIARFLGKDIYGEYGIIKNTLTYLAIVSTFGFGYTATKYVAEYKEREDPKIGWLVRHIVQFTIAFSTFLAFLLLVFSKQIAVFIEAPELSCILRKYSIIVVFNALVSTQIGVLSGLKLFKINARVNSYSGISLFVFSLFFTYVWGLDGAVLALLLSFLLQTILNHYYINDYLKSYTVKANGTKSEFVSMLSFSLPIALQEGLYTIVRWVTIFLLIKYSDYGEVGLSSAASTWAAIVIFIPGMLKNVMFSYLTTTDNHNHLVNRLLLFNLISTVIPVVIFVAFSKLICSFYGPSFTGLQSVLILSLISAVFTSVSEVYCYDFISRGYPWTVFAARFFRDFAILLLGWAILSRVSCNHAMYLALISLIGGALFYFVLFLLYRRNSSTANRLTNEK